ncbi:hypothetical protein BGX24_002888 [Mortierella sp. AD032]|nr:hypothetical protein BGX24_002888 [Mortierella sp. AD032]
MGVMIQCETCKVWQHCPCVGLGDGLVTPDKYYCDSCRPENHPYHVVDGVLQSDTAAAEHNQQGNVTRASKRRKKMDSTLDDLDHTPLHGISNSSSSSANSHQTDDESETTPAPMTTKASKKAAVVDREKSTASAGGSSKSTASNSKRKKGTTAAYELSAAAASSIVVTTMTSIPVQPEEPSPIADQDSESASTSAAPSTRRNARSTNTKKYSRAAPADDAQETIHIVPASKRRRTAEPTTRLKEESVAETEDEDKQSDKDSTPTESAAEAPATRSRKGHSTRANKKIDPVDDEQAESTMLTEEFPSASEDSAKADSAVPEMTKRGGALRKAQQNHGHHHHHSRHCSPAGTPQPTPAIIIQPTKIKYPSAKMTMPDMNKRVKQLLEYMSHAQAEMSEMQKSRDAAAVATMDRAKAAAIAAAVCENSALVLTDCGATSSSSSDSQPTWLSTPPRSVHEPSRSESLDPMTQPSSSMTTEQNLDSSVLQQEGSRQGSGGQAPMTPPPQNEAGSCNTNTGIMNCDDTGSKELETGTKADTPVLAPMSCLEQINKLTHDLLHFKQKFGHKSDV